MPNGNHRGMKNAYLFIDTKQPMWAIFSAHDTMGEDDF